MLPNGNWEWTKLQASVYGPEILRATPFEGFREFVAAARRQSIKVSIISHKSSFAAADPGGCNLQEAARRWLRKNRLLDESLTISSADVFFEESIEGKLARIRDLKCSHFIDDLQEVLLEPGFPSGTVPILFSADDADVVSGICAFPTWYALREELLGA